MNFLSTNLSESHSAPDWTLGRLSRWTKFFLFSCAIVLALSCVLKLIAITNFPKYGFSHPFIPPAISKSAYVFVTALEALFVCILILMRSMRHRLLLVAWMGLNFFLFHVSALAAGGSMSCGCFGRLGGTELIALESKLAFIFSLYMLVGSLAVLIAHRYAPVEHVREPAIGGSSV